MLINILRMNSSNCMLGQISEIAVDLDRIAALNENLLKHYNFSVPITFYKKDRYFNISNDKLFSK
jgi:hypothetical protein